MNKIFSNNKFNIFFYNGILFFNSGEINEAHITWENIWKNGKEKDRKFIKGFIQLSGATINEKLNKQEAALYLYKKSIYNLKLCILETINSNNIEQLIRLVQKHIKNKNEPIKISISKQTFLS